MGQTISTGIFKEPVAGRVQLRRFNLEGDVQSDLSAHGGPDKAVYAYPFEHYHYWRGELGVQELPWGMFGENFTVEGLLEDSLSIGDRLRIGSAELMVRQPRSPCYKLGIKFGRADMVKRFLASRRTGFYLSVVREGEVAGGDAIELIHANADTITVADLTRLYAFEKNDWQTMERALELETLPEGWRRYFRERLTGQRK
jgi:MOSC domain-containing protein YiiM